MITCYLTKSKKSGKKFTVVIDDGKSRMKTIHFGAYNMSDFTKHKDTERKQRYINRHKNNEKWGKSGIKSAGFWSKHILWNKPSIGGSVRATASKFKIKIKRSSPPKSK